MVAGGHELAMFGGRGARAVALYRSRGAGLREFDLALLRRHVRRQERALRACLGAQGADGHSASESAARRPAGIPRDGDAIQSHPAG